MLQNQPLLLFFLGLILIWLGVLTLIILKTLKAYKVMTSGISQQDLTTTLIELKKHASVTDKALERINEILQKTDIRLKSHIQKLGFVRYNPFGNTGGDQSFCLCLLDESGNGILITSLHTRQQTRIYTKLLQEGKSVEGAPLSKEELACVKKAKNWSSL